MGMGGFQGNEGSRSVGMGMVGRKVGKGMKWGKREGE